MASSDRLVGRRAEGRWLLERLRRAHQGAPQCVLLSGPPGIGKTRLAAETRDEARQLGFVTLLGRGYEGVTVPLLLYRDGVFAGLERLLDDGSGPPAALAVVRGDAADVTPEPTDATATTLLLELVELIVAASMRRPLCLVLDDLHWADSSSIALVRHLLDRLESGLGAIQLFVLLVARPAPVLASLVAEPFCARLELGALDQLETAELARQLGAVGVAMGSVWTQTRGIPLLIESLAHSSAGAPGRLRADSAFDARFSALSSTAVAVLERAALLVPDIDVDTLERIGPWTADAVGAAIDEAVLADLLIVDDTGVRFSHPMARERCVRDLGPYREARLHADIARALGPPDGANLTTVARHLVLAGREADADTVGDIAKAAALRARTLCAWDEAAELFEAQIAAEHRRAAAPDRGDLAAAHLAAGKCRQRALDVDSAVRHFDEAILCSESTDDALGETLARTERLIIGVGAGNVPDADVDALAALAARIEDIVPEAAAEALNDISQAQWAAFRIEDARHTIAHVLELAEEHGLGAAAAKAYVSRAITRWFTIDLEGSLGDIDLAETAIRGTEDVWRRATLPAYRRPLPLIWLGRIDEADQAVRRADDLSRELGSFYEYGLVLAARVALALLRGDIAGAEADADRALRLEALSAYHWPTALILPALAYAHAARGDDASARWALATWEARADPQARILVDLLRARLEPATDDAPVRQALDAARWLPREPFLGAQDLAILCVEIVDGADEPEVAGVAGALIDATRARGMVVSSAMNVLLDRVAGDAHALTGDRDTARDRYHAAVEIATRIGATGERALALLGLARLDASTDRTAATASLRRALIDLERAELARPLAQAQTLAEQLGIEEARAPVSAVVSEEATVLFVDIVDSTRLTEQLGDVEYRARARTLERALRLVIADHGGSAVPGINVGDGVLALFRDPEKAVAAAFGAVRAASTGKFRLHVGLHHGRVLHDADLISGAAVNVAARVCATSSPDEVLVSETMRNLLTRTDRAGIPFVDRGMHRLKGVTDPHHLFAALPNT